MKMVSGLAVMLWLCGCSFNKEWKAAVSSPVPANSIEGPWTGEWRSDRNGHHGALRCIVAKNPDATYRARFRATYWKIARFTYTATLNGVETNGVTALKGEANLGKLVGVYKYDGSATPEEFRSTYSSKHDKGEFQMARPEQ
jgi:hypothetical protein